MTQTEIGVVVLATGDTGFCTPAALNGSPPSLVEVGGSTLAARVVAAASEAEGLGDVVLVGGESDLGADIHIAATNDPVVDILAGLAALKDSAYAVILPGHIPFVRGPEIAAFARAAAAESVQLAYPLVTREGCESAFPELRRTYFRLLEGELTGGNALFVDVPTFLADPSVIERANEIRREPWKLALSVNPLIVMKFNSGKLSCGDIGDMAEAALGLRSAVVPINAPGLATDVTKPIHLKVARERLG